MWLFPIQGVGIGFAAAAKPGPFQTYLISQSLARGWRRTLIAACAPLISDGPVIAVCLLMLSQIPAWFERFLHLASGLFILYLAFSAYKAWRSFDSNLPAAESVHQKSLLTASLVDLLSPGPYLFWSLIAIIVAFGVMSRFAQTFHRTLIGFSALALFCFGLYQLWLGLT